MANIGGTNQFGQSSRPLIREKPYGAVQDMDRLRRSAVMAGQQGISSALNAPRRAKRQQVRSGREREAAPAQPQAGSEPLPAQAPPEPTLPYETRVLARWEQAANAADASPEAKRMLERARRLAGAA